MTDIRGPTSEVGHTTSRACPVDEIGKDNTTQNPPWSSVVDPDQVRSSLSHLAQVGPG
jgi:hypothetical protein